MTASIGEQRFCGQRVEVLSSSMVVEEDEEERLAVLRRGRERGGDMRRICSRVSLPLSLLSPPL